MRELTDFRDGVDEATGLPLTIGELRRRARRRRAQRWAVGVGAPCVVALFVAAVVAVNGDDGRMVDRGVLVASPDEMDVLGGAGADGPRADAASGDIVYMLRSVDAVVEIQRIELVDEVAGAVGDLRNLVFAADVAPIDGAPPLATGDSTRIYEPVWQDRASLVSLIEPRTRVVALLDVADPTVDGGIPRGATHSLDALLTITDEGQVTFLALEPRHLNAALATAREASSFEGADLELLVAWIEELGESPDGGPITEAYRSALAPEEPEWDEIPPDERSVEPGAAPADVLAGLHQFQVLVEVRPVASTAGPSEDAVWVTSDIGIHHVATLHNSIGDVWLAPDSLLSAGIRTPDGSALVADVRMPTAPAVVEGGTATLLIAVTAVDDTFLIDGKWIDAVAARDVLQRWADPAASAPSPESD